MNEEFLSVHNHYEQAVFRAVTEAQDQFPDLAKDPSLLADVACVALNRLQPRYIRHEVDYSFYITNAERRDQERLIAEAVRFAFDYVQARVASVKVV